MVSTHDLLGQIHVSYTKEASIEGYFNTVDHLKNVCEKNQFSDMVSGFYINTSKVQGSARLSYFINPEIIGIDSDIVRFLGKNGISVNRISLAPSALVITNGYKWPLEKEKKLREFLVDYTKIGLEMMRNNLQHARCLMATYRFQVRLASLSISEHFKRSFEILSPTYNSWDTEKRLRFLRNLSEWPMRTQVDWAHFMVNLILPNDFNSVFGDSNYSHYKIPLSISEINQIVKQVNLQIENDWTPNAIS